MSAPAVIPELVSSALDLSRQRGFITSTRHETGRLLATLAASRTGTLAELGTGCGVGSAWLSTGAGDKTHIISAELDPSLAEDVQEIFADTENVEVIAGDWRTLEQYGPFSLLFVDTHELMDVDALASVLEPGGIAVLDDFEPSASWPPIVDGVVDVVRERWLTDEQFVAVEMMITADASLLIATRR